MRRPPHLRLMENVIDTATGEVIASFLVRKYRTRKGAERRRAKAAANSARWTPADSQTRVEHVIERIPMAEREAA